MVRNYKRKTGRAAIDENLMTAAIRDCLNKVETATSAAAKYNIKRTTLISRLKKPEVHESRALQTVFGSKYSTRQILTLRRVFTMRVDSHDCFLVIVRECESMFTRETFRIR